MLPFIRSKKGSTEIYVLVAVLFCAFLLGGGEAIIGDLTGANNITPTPTPASSSNSSDWSIELINTACDSANSVSNVSVGLHGPQTGYYTISIDGTVKSTQDFTPNDQNLMSVVLPIPNSWGVNTKPWVIELFSGGTNQSGGTSRTTKTMDATNCL